MKFEQVLKIYWTKGFFFNGKLVSFDTTLSELITTIGGLGRYSKTLTIKRFEFTQKISKSQASLFSKSSIPQLTNLSRNLKNLQKVFNIYLSQLVTVDAVFAEMFKYNLIRLYLIKSYRGRCQAIGKPSRGQRT